MKKKTLVLIVGIFVFLMIFLFCRKAYGSMAAQNSGPAIEDSESAEEKVEDAEEMNDTVTGRDTDVKNGGSAMESRETAVDSSKESTVESGDPAAESGETTIESAETAEDRVAVVDDKMNEVLESEEYGQMSPAERRELVSDILRKLEQAGYITGLTFDEGSGMYSFTYADGTLGGWQIEDFSGQDDLLPMN